MGLPEGFRVRLHDEVAGDAVALELPRRRIWPAGLITGVMFVIFAAVGWQVVGMVLRPVRDVFDLMTMLFMGFWLLGWSVGVFFLGAVTVLLFFYQESARTQQGRLLVVPRLGPVKIIMDYELSRVRNVRVERADSDDKAKVRFDYDQATRTLGDTMPRADAERLAQRLIGAGASSKSKSDRESFSPPAAASIAAIPSKKTPDLISSDPIDTTDSSRDGLVPILLLIAANMLPLAGVLFFGWDLATVMVLFWAESAVIGFYTALKMAVTGKIWALFAVPFFIGHFGGFMAMHFMFIYLMFIRGPHAVGVGPGPREALLKIFGPLWIPLAALFVSHGVSFVSNFLGRREYERTNLQTLMAAPYSRIMPMQLAIIFGGWLILLLNNPVPALALLVGVKTLADLQAHKKEHRVRT